MAIQPDRLYRLRELVSLKPSWLGTYRFHQLICAHLIPRLNQAGFMGIKGAHIAAVLDAENLGHVSQVTAPDVPGYILPGPRIGPEDVTTGTSLQLCTNLEDGGVRFTPAEWRAIRRAGSRGPGKPAIDGAPAVQVENQASVEAHDSAGAVAHDPGGQRPAEAPATVQDVSHANDLALGDGWSGPGLTIHAGEQWRVTAGT